MANKTTNSQERCKHDLTPDISNNAKSDHHYVARLWSERTLDGCWKNPALILWVLAIAAILLSAEIIQAQQEMGYVLDLKGDWVLDGNPPQQIKKPAVLHSGDTIRRRSKGSDDDFIQILGLDNKIIPWSCKPPNDCSQPFALQKPASSTSSFSSFLSDVAKMLLTEVVKRSNFGSRAPGEQTLTEAVIKVNEGKLDLSPAFSDIKQGSYKLRFRPIAIDDSPISTRPVVLERVNLIPKVASPIWVEGVRAGLYILQILDSQDEPAWEAWILAADSNKYDKTAACFQEIIGLTRNWNNAVKEDTVRLFLRGGLAYLSTRDGKCR